MLSIGVDITSFGFPNTVGTSSVKLLSTLKEFWRRFSRNWGVRRLPWKLCRIMFMSSLYAPPRFSPAYIVNYLKGKSARKVLQRFPELKSGAGKGKLWSRSYFVATVGSVTADLVKKYVEEQWGKER